MPTETQRPPFGVVRDYLKFKGVRRMWAQVRKLQDNGSHAHAFTQEHKRVLVALSHHSMKEVHKGDFISFTPAPFMGTQNPHAPVDYYALDPQIIGWAIGDDDATPAHAPADVAEQIATGETK